MSDKTMTKDEAKKHVQKLLAQAEGLLEEAGRVMDEHQFSSSFMGQEYFPRNMQLVTYDDGQEIEDDDKDYQYVRPKEDDMSWMYFYSGDYKWLAGTWKSSSQYKGC